MTGSGEKKRGSGGSAGGRLRWGSNAAVSIVAAAAILVMVNYLSARHYHRADWTSSGLYTLSDKSEKVLSALGAEVEMYVLWSQADPRFPDVKEILDRYLSRSSKIRIEFVDPDMSPDRLKMIIDRYGAKVRQDASGMMGIEQGVFVVRADNVKFVSSAQFEDFGGDVMMGAQGGEEDELSRFEAEQEITSAILRVTRDEQATVCFTQGHGEWLFEGYGGRALGHLKEDLRQDSYKVRAISLAGASRVPGDCAVVVVAGPSRAFMEEEAALLEGYLGSGGRLLLLLDPLVEGDRFVPTGLEGLAARRGIELARDIVLEVDARRLVSPTPVTFLASEFTSHEAVKPLSVPESVGAEIREQLGAYPVVFSTARSLARSPETDAAVEVLARTSSESWGEVDLASLGSGESVPEKGDLDNAGPTALAMAASLSGPDPSGGGRLVVVGDSDFLSEDLFVSASLYNRDFWSGVLGWLASRADLISIAPKNPEHVRLSLTEQDVSIIWQVVIGEVILVLVVGVIVWIRRRS